MSTPQSSVGVSVYSSFPKPPRRPPSRYSDILRVPTHRYVSTVHGLSPVCCRAEVKGNEDDDSQLMIASPDKLSNIVSPDEHASRASDSHRFLDLIRHNYGSISPSQEDVELHDEMKSKKSANLSCQRHCGKEAAATPAVGDGLGSVCYDAREGVAGTHAHSHNDRSCSDGKKSSLSLRDNSNKTGGKTEHQAHKSVGLNDNTNGFAEMRALSSPDSSLLSVSFRLLDETVDGDSSKESINDAATPIVFVARGAPVSPVHDTAVQTPPPTATLSSTATRSVQERKDKKKAAAIQQEDEFAPTPSRCPPSLPSPTPAPCCGSLSDAPRSHAACSDAVSKELEMWSARIQECVSASRSPVLQHEYNPPSIQNGSQEDCERAATRQLLLRVDFASARLGDGVGRGGRGRSVDEFARREWMQMNPSVLGGTELMPALPRLQGTRHCDAKRELRVAVTMDRLIARQPASRGVELLHAMRDLNNREISLGGAMLRNSSVDARAIDQRAC